MQPDDLSSLPPSANPIHVVATPGPSSEARSEALRAFHKGLDQADRNLQSLLPARRPSAAGPSLPAETPAFAFEMRAPWYVDAADQAAQPA